MPPLLFITFIYLLFCVGVCAYSHVLICMHPMALQFMGVGFLLALYRFWKWNSDVRFGASAFYSLSHFVRDRTSHCTLAI